MTRQKSENFIVPKGRRKTVPTERARGGKEVPVEKEIRQLGLAFATAEHPKGSPRQEDTGLSVSRLSPREPKAHVKASKILSATIESVIECLDEALIHVVRNKGSAGPNGRSVEDVLKDWTSTHRVLAATLRSGTYTPGPILRVEIPKPGGGVRDLGIPDVEDRVVQQSIRMCLQPKFEPGFHESSHGFRPKRSCHSAILEAKGYVEEGYEWVVDLDLSKFFDRVHHQRLMARVALEVQDREFLVLLGRLLKSSVLMPDGTLQRPTEGVPQGGPLSPLLSNIVLDELDYELDRRGHRFVRYADDVAIFVRSERAGERVMRSLTQFIERRMRLKVNEEKSSVHRPNVGNFLGFRLLTTAKGTVEILPSKRTMKRASARLRELTPRNWGSSLYRCIQRTNRYLRGWFAFFGICSPRAKRNYQRLDSHLRRRMRAIKLKQWKRKITVVRKLNRMKYSKTVARNIYRGRRGWWALSIDAAVNHRLSNRWFLEQGLEPLCWLYKKRKISKVAQPQISFEWG